MAKRIIKMMVEIELDDEGHKGQDQIRTLTVREIDGLTELTNGVSVVDFDADEEYSWMDATVGDVLPGVTLSIRIDAEHEMTGVEGFDADVVVDPEGNMAEARF